MNKSNKIILLSFASNDLKKSIFRFEKQAQETKFYDEIRIITYSDLDNNFKSILKKLLSDGKKKTWYTEHVRLVNEKDRLSKSEKGTQE